MDQTRHVNGAEQQQFTPGGPFFSPFQDIVQTTQSRHTRAVSARLFVDGPGRRRRQPVMLRSSWNGGPRRVAVASASRPSDTDHLGVSPPNLSPLSLSICRAELTP